MNRQWEILRCLTEAIYTLSITAAALKWSSYIAYAQRGYEAVGSEYFFAGIAGYIASARLMVKVGENDFSMLRDFLDMANLEYEVM